MRNINKGFGLIGLVISIAIIAVLVFGTRYFTEQKNQVDQGQEAIDQAQEAADKQNQNTFDIQNNLNSSADVNFHSAVDKARNLK